LSLLAKIVSVVNMLISKDICW